MREWDYLHSPPGTEHITVGAGDEPCAILMFGSRDTEAYGDMPEPVRVPPPPVVFATLAPYLAAVSLAICVRRPMRYRFSLMAP